MRKDAYITQISGITPHSQIKNQSKASFKSGARNTRRKLKLPSRVQHWIIRKETQWSGIQKITRFNHYLTTSKTQQFEPCITHYKLIHSHLITYTYTYICIQYLSGYRSLDHMISKQRNKIYSIQGREPTQESSQTQRLTFSKRRSHSKSSF